MGVVSGYYTRFMENVRLSFNRISMKKPQILAGYMRVSPMSPLVCRHQAIFAVLAIRKIGATTNSQ